MGIAFFASLAVLAAMVALPGIAAVVSARLMFRIPLYWILCVLSIALLPLLLFERPPTTSGGEYAALAYLLEAAFNWTSLICALGGLVCLGLAYVKYDLVQTFSAVSWGLFAAAAVRLFVVSF